MRGRALLAFVAGFVVGIVALGAVIWRSGFPGRIAPPAQPAASAPAPPQVIPRPPAPPPHLPQPLPAIPKHEIPPPPDDISAVEPRGEASREVGSGAAHVPDQPAQFPRRLLIPVAGIDPQSLVDTFDQARGGGERRHEALDIMAPRGTPVYSADEGNIVKLFDSKQGGLTIYQFDNAQEYCYYYAHLERYAPGLKEGMLVRRGDVIGYVGSSGDAAPEAPHLHFAIYKLGPEKKWWKGNTPLNPYPILARNGAGSSRPED